MDLILTATADDFFNLGRLVHVIENSPCPKFFYMAFM